MRFKIVFLFALLASSPAFAEEWKITITPGPARACNSDSWGYGLGGFAAQQESYVRSILARDEAQSRASASRYSGNGYRRFTGVVIQQRIRQ